MPYAKNCDAATTSSFSASREWVGTRLRRHGCRMHNLTTDDRSNVRLNNEIPPASERFVDCNCQLWREVLLSKKRLLPGFRRPVRFNLASSHLGVCKWRWRSGRFVASFWHLFQLMKADPELLAWIVRKRS